MKCPLPIAEILLSILQTGILRIRAAAWAGNNDQAAIEAEHIHNLPSILRDYQPDLLKFYWEIERKDFISKVPDHGAFLELWNKLESFTDSLEQTVLVP